MINIKKAEDIQVLSNLAKEIWNEYWVELLSQDQIDYMVEKFQSESAMKNQIEKENYNYYYIFNDDVICGYMAICNKNTHLFLSKLYLKKEFRHRGLGQASFEFVKKEAKGQNLDRIILTVKKDNVNAIKAYIKWGFNVIESTVTDIGNGFVMDDYVMEYSFK